MYNKFLKIETERKKNNGDGKFYYCIVNDKIIDFIPHLMDDGRIMLHQLFTLPIKEDFLVEKVYSSSTIIKKYGIKSLRASRIIENKKK